MEYPKYETKWVDVLPPIGVECPVCKVGIVEGNSFTDKKGSPWQSVKCNQCQTKWMKSKRSASAEGGVPEGSASTSIPSLDDRIVKSLALIRGDIQTVKDVVTNIEAQTIGKKV